MFGMAWGLGVQGLRPGFRTAGLMRIVLDYESHNIQVKKELHDEKEPRTLQPRCSPVNGKHEPIQQVLNLNY